VDRRFRAHGPEGEVKIYGRARSSVERVNSRLDDLVCLNRHRLRASGTSQSTRPSASSPCYWWRWPRYAWVCQREPDV
jgi:hypothetical protein